MDLRLNQLKPGEKATVTGIETESALRRRLMDIGLVENTVVECVGKSPMGDPVAYLIRGAVIAIRSRDCSGISIRKSG
ncbi:MAG: ferrous iron transport protein A [Ruminococcaceae bacterium]|nr:ferrous iron transport protein A [Oscillospiraceae bacterium]